MSTKPLNILVVDDDENFAHTLCAILKSAGYQCQEVHSAKEAQKNPCTRSFRLCPFRCKNAGKKRRRILPGN